MNNEDKILQMLVELRKGQAEMRSDIADLKATQAEQGKVLAEHGKVLAEQGELLKEIDQRSIRTQVLLETEVRDNIKLLFDGHSELKRELETLATKEQVKALSDSVDVIKDVVRRHSGEIGELKKAQ